MHKCAILFAYKLDSDKPRAGGETNTGPGNGSWLLREPLRLAVQDERPIYQGPLILLAGPERLESGWWSLLSAEETEGQELALRDYYVARSPHAGLLWVYRRRSAGEPAWFLQGCMGDV